MSQEQSFPAEQFKELLITFLKNNFKESEYVISSIEDDENEKELKKHLCSCAEEVYELLGGNVSNFDEDAYLDEIYDLKSEISDLEEENEELKSELEDIKYVIGKSLDDEYKLKIIKEYANNYRYWELEELLKNGREYFKQ